MAEANIPRRTATAVPAGFARRPLRTIRPADATREYAYPRPQFARLEKAGVLHRAAHGYYNVVPQENVGQGWLPQLEATAAGIAAADFGLDKIVLMGVSAARIHGAIPRALAVAVVAVPVQRGLVRLQDREAIVRFVKRDTDRLDAERLPTELGRALVTTVEQTVLDLAHRPQLGDAEPDAVEAIRILFGRCDVDRLDDIATAQRLGAALRRADAIARR